MAKGPDAFRTISEAADELGVAQHVLRFWETRFSFIKPMKRAGGRRFYRPHDIDVLRGVRRLLHEQGYTIKGVQRLYREEGQRRLISVGQETTSRQFGASGMTADVRTETSREGLRDALATLESVKAKLDRLLSMAT